MFSPQDCKRYPRNYHYVVRENQLGVRKLIAYLEAVIKEFVPKVMMEIADTFSLGSGVSVLESSFSVTLPLDAVSVPGGMERRTVFFLKGKGMVKKCIFSRSFEVQGTWYCSRKGLLEPLP